MKHSRLISFVTLVTSSFTLGAITLPIAFELNSVFPKILLMSIIVIGIVVLNSTLERKIYKFISSEINRHKNKHIEEFFNFIENDKEFLNNVLKRTIPIIENNEKIGEQTIYSALFSKKHYFFNN